MFCTTPPLEVPCGPRFSEDDWGRAVTRIRNFSSAGRECGAGWHPAAGWLPALCTCQIESGAGLPSRRRMPSCPTCRASQTFRKLHILHQLSNGFLESVLRRTSVRRLVQPRPYQTAIDVNGAGGLNAEEIWNLAKVGAVVNHEIGSLAGFERADLS